MPRRARSAPGQQEDPGGAGRGALRLRAAGDRRRRAPRRAGVHRRMYTLLSGLYKYMFQKDEYCILILGLDNAGKTVGGVR